MKKLLIFLFALSTHFIVEAQATLNKVILSDKKTEAIVKNTLKVDSNLIPPIRDTNFIASIYGQPVVRPQDSLMYVSTGLTGVGERHWVRLGSSSGGSGAIWGVNITGNISAQSDLQALVALKQNLLLPGTINQFWDATGGLQTIPIVPPQLNLTSPNGTIVIAGTYPNITAISGITNLNQLTNGPGYITANQPISISGDATAGPSATSLNLVLATVNSSPGSCTNCSLTVDGKGRVSVQSSGTGSNLITSVFTRTGAITAQSGDYTAAQVTNAVSTLGSYTNPSWLNSIPWTKVTTPPNTIAGYGITDNLVNTFNTRSGAVSLTSSDVTSALGYTPVTNARTLTINGTTFDLSANRTWTISGTGYTASDTGYSHIVASVFLLQKVNDSMKNVNNGVYLQKSLNFSDIASASTARSNLGLGTAAMQANSFFANRVSPIDSLPRSANGVQHVSGNLIPQTADPTHPGFISGASQAFLDSLHNGTGQAMISFDSMALVNNTAAQLGLTVRVRGYHFPGDQGAGDFSFFLGSSLTPVQGMIINVTGGQLIRQYTGELHGGWFGVRADGVSNDSLPIAIGLAYAVLTHNTLVLPNGFIICPRIAFPGGDVWLRGNGSSVLVAPPTLITANIAMIDLSHRKNIHISDLEIDCSGYAGNINAGNLGIRLGNDTNVVIENVYLHNNLYQGISLQNYNVNIKILNNNIYKTDCGIIGIGNGTGNENVLIQGNFISYGTSDGIVMQGASSTFPSASDNIRIIGNQISHKVNGILFSYGTNILANDNIIDSCISGVGGISSSGPDYSSHISLTGNHIRRIYTNAISNIGSNALISDNVIDSIGREAIALGNTTDTLHIDSFVVVHHNIVTNFNTRQISNFGGIRVQNCYNCSIDNNTLWQGASKNTPGTFALKKQFSTDSNLVVSQNNFSDGQITSDNRQDAYVRFERNTVYNINLSQAFNDTLAKKTVFKDNIYTSGSINSNLVANGSGYFSGINNFNPRGLYNIGTSPAISTIEGSFIGRVITLVSKANGNSIISGTNIKLKNGINITLDLGQYVTLWFDGLSWIQTDGSLIGGLTSAGRVSPIDSLPRVLDAIQIKGTSVIPQTADATHPGFISGISQAFLDSVRLRQFQSIININHPGPGGSIWAGYSSPDGKTLSLKNWVTNTAFQLTTQTDSSLLLSPNYSVLVGLTNTQTLTNKTLTSPTITSPTVSTPILTGARLGTTSTLNYVWTATDALGNGSWQVAQGGTGTVNLSIGQTSTTNTITPAGGGTPAVILAASHSNAGLLTAANAARIDSTVHFVRTGKGRTMIHVPYTKDSVYFMGIGITGTNGIVPTYTGNADSVGFNLDFDPFTTQGDQVVGGVSGTPTIVPAGPSTYQWTSNGPGTTPSWQAPTSGSVSSVDVTSASLGILYSAVVNNKTTTPITVFTPTAAPAYSILGNITASSAAYAWVKPQLTSPMFANQGATNLVYHGNASGNGSFAAVNLLNEVTGTLQAAQSPAYSGAISTVAGSLVTTLGAGVVGTTNIGAGAVLLTTQVGGVLSSTNGGTSVNNGGRTFTIAGNFATVGANNITLTSTAATNVTLPTSGTLLANNGNGSSLTGIPLSITGTTNEVIVSNPTGAIVLSTPQPIAPGSSPTFTGLTLTGLGAGLSTDQVLTIQAGIVRSLTLPVTPSMLYSGIGFTQVANTTSELSLTGSGTGTQNIAANSLIAGKTIRIHVSGVLSTAVTPGNLTIRLKLGSTTLASAVITNLVSSMTGQGFDGYADIVCWTTGTSGIIAASGQFNFPTTTTGLASRSAADLTNGGNTSTINTTIANVLDVTAQWVTASSSNNVKDMTFTIETLN